MHLNVFEFIALRQLRMNQGRGRAFLPGPSVCCTKRGAQVALQRCPILRLGMITISLNEIPILKNSEKAARPSAEWATRARRLDWHGLLEPFCWMSARTGISWPTGERMGRGPKGKNLPVKHPLNLNEAVCGTEYLLVPVPVREQRDRTVAPRLSRRARLAVWCRPSAAFAKSRSRGY